jgi:SAM-dependent methyltransferase
VPWALAAGRASELTHRGVLLLRDLLLASRLAPHEQEALTLALYQKASTYSPGGTAFEQGLFSWEERVFSDPIWPASGRILVGAAGAGREALALVRRGFEVVAFEPCPPLAEAGHLLAQRTPGLTFHEGSYGDLIAAVQGHGGPLASLRDASFDAVVLGWGSLSHLLDRGQRAALLRALPRLAPGGPVLMSFLVDWPRGGREQRLRAALRRRLGADLPHFSPEAGFFHLFTRGEVEALAAEAGYTPRCYQEDPYPHALLALSPRRP